MKCIKCGKRYKKTLIKCPSCNEINPTMLEDKTIAIQEINEDLSLTGLISNQIEEFNESKETMKKSFEPVIEVIKEELKMTNGESGETQVIGTITDEMLGILFL